MKRFFTTARMLDILFLVLLSLIPLLWFRHGMIMVGHDNVFPISPLGYFRDRLFTWSEHHGLGYDQSSDMGGLMIHMWDALPFLLGLSLQTTQKVVYCFWTFLMLFSAYFFVVILEKWQYIRTRYLRYFLPLLYTFNFYTLQGWWIGERTKFSLMVVLPIFLILLLSLVRTKQSIFKTALIAALVPFVFNGGGLKGITLYGGLFVAIICFVGYFSLIEKSVLLLRKFFIFFCFTSFIFVMLNAYSLLPFLSHTLDRYKEELVTVGGPSSTFEWIQMMSRDASFINLFRLEGVPEWYTNFDHPYGRLYIEHPLLIILSFLFPVLLCISFIWKKQYQEKKLYFYFVSLFLLSAFFTAGSHEPFGFLYRLLVQYIPGFAIFRSPIFKFGYTYWFANVFLIGYCLSKICELLSSRYLSLRRFSPVVVFVLSSIVLLYEFPFLTGNMFSWSKGQLSTRVEIPTYIFDAVHFMEKKGDTGRILLLPRASPEWNASMYKWKFFSLFPLTATMSRLPFLYNNDSLTKRETTLVHTLYDAILAGDTPLIRVLSSILRTKYFINRMDYFYDLSWGPTESPELYARALEKNEAFVSVATFGAWKIYELKDTVDVGHAYTATTKTLYYSSEHFHLGDVTKFVSESQQGNSHNALPFLDEVRPGVTSEKMDGTLEAIYVLDCLNCKALMTTPSVIYPQKYIFPNSPLYPLIDFIKGRKKTAPILLNEAGYYHILGESLSVIAQLNGLSSLERQDASVSPAIVRVGRQLNERYNTIGKILSLLSNNPVSRITHTKNVLEYLLSEKRIFRDILVRRLGREDYNELLSIYQNLLFLIDRFQVTYKDFDFHGEAIYTNSISEGIYAISLKTTEEMLQNQQKQLLLHLDDTIATPQATLKDTVFYNNISVSKDGLLRISFAQKSEVKDIEALTYTYFGDPQLCVGAQIVAPKKANPYEISFRYMNDFSNRLRFVIFPLGGSQASNATNSIGFEPVSKSELVYNPDEVQRLQYTYYPEKDYPTVFIGICSPQMNLGRFKEKIDGFAIYHITSPKLVLHRQGDGNESKASAPYTLYKINQTKYELDIPGAVAPYYINFFEKFNPDWKLYIQSATVARPRSAKVVDAIIEPGIADTWLLRPLPEDDHFMVNGYSNGWKIDEKGSYRIIIEYRPQKLFYQGCVISMLSLGIAMGILWRRKGKPHVH